MPTDFLFTSARLPQPGYNINHNILGFPTRNPEGPDSSKEEPELLQHILAPVNKDDLQNEARESDSNTVEPKFVELNDHLYLLDPWAEYLEQKWKPWAKEHRRLMEVQKVYAALFTIYQKLKSLGEEFELVLGFGLLSWQTPTNQRVYRHLITCHAAIWLDPNRGTIFVGSAAEGPKPALEHDMLEASERPTSEDQVRLEEQISKLGDDIWNTADMNAALRGWVHSVSAEAAYSDELARTSDITRKPFVCYSPTLILRKRTERGLIRVYQEIIEQLRSGVEIPTGIERTVEIIDDRRTDSSTSSPSDIEFKEIYFPLPANDEQIRIVKSLFSRQGVLVQGPPGTGKSHTIANLICHLLADAKRVLVTSQTPRALRVLKGKLPKEMAALCVSVLGNDSFALKDLEESVQGITDRYDNWDPIKNSRLINSLKQDLNEAKKQMTILTTRLREIRECEIYVHNLCGGAYRGTAQQIAQQVFAGRPAHGWLRVNIAQDTAPPLRNEEPLDLLALHREFSSEKIADTERHILPLENLPTPEEFVRQHDAEMVAKNVYSDFSGLVETDTFKRLRAATSDQRSELAEAIDKLLAMRATILKHPYAWENQAVDDILSGRDRSWRELYIKSAEHLSGLLEEARSAEERNLSLPSGPERAAVKADAEALLEHVRRGGRLGFPGFRPKVIKRAWYLLKETKIDGRLCDNVECLKALIATLSVDEHLDKLWSYWKPFASRREGSRPAQVGELQDLCDVPLELLHLHELLTNAKGACGAIDGLLSPAWQLVDEVEFYRRALEGVTVEENLQQARSLFTQTDQTFRSALTKPDVHPVMAQGHIALVERDDRGYGVFYAELQALNETRRRLARRKQLDGVLHLAAPSIAEQLSLNPMLDSWDDALSHFTEA